VHPPEAGAVLVPFYSISHQTVTINELSQSYSQGDQIPGQSFLIEEGGGGGVQSDWGRGERGGGEVAAGQGEIG
jgi:hypothetical protein